MRFRRLEVEYFKCIEHVALDFGPGLNVLHGPNELGKSTLVEAMRAALLLPPSSTHANSFVSWTGGHSPRVVLDFEIEPDAMWRVEKEFGSTTATLATSRDGRAFRQKARGRNVDGRLRDLLSLGVPAPGGRRAPRGLPSSFLVEVIFPRQDEVTGLLEASLQDDPSESGRLRLTGALEAMAQDPFFKQILSTVQRKVTEAFTATGQRRRGAASPFTAIADRVKKAQADLDEYQSTVAKGHEVEERLQQLIEQRVEHKAQLDDLEAQLIALQAAATRAAQRIELEGRLGTARESEAKIRKTLEELDEARRNVTRDEKHAAQAERELADARQRFKKAQKHKETASEERRRVAGHADAQRLEIEQNKLDQEIVRVDADIERAQREIAAADATKALILIEATRDGVRDELAEAEETLRQSQEDQHLLDGVGVLAALEEAEAQIVSGQSALATAEQLEAEATGKREEATELETTLRERVVPEQSAIESLRRLQRQLDQAEALLEVGISLRIDPLRSLPASIARDGATAERRTIDEATELDADREIAVELTDIAKLTVVGGRSDARHKAKRTREQWDEEAQPVLASAGVTDLEALTALRSDTDQKQAQIDRVLSEAEQLDAQARTHKGTAADVEHFRKLAERKRTELNRFDEEAVRARKRDIGETSAAADEADARAKDSTERAAGLCASTRETLSQIEIERSAAAARLQELCTGDADEIRRLREHYESVHAQSSAAVNDLQDQRSQLQCDRQRLGSDHEAALVAARLAEDEAQAELVRAEEQQTAAAQAQQEASTELERWRARLAERERTPTTESDLKEAAATSIDAEKQLAELPDIAAGASQERADQVKKHLQGAEAELRQKDEQIATTRGHLQQIGGETARERRDAARERLERLKQHEEDLHLDYGAWRKLADVLEEVEKEQSVHLGRALEEPVGRRLSELTGGRYEGLLLDQHLGTGGVLAAGDERSMEELSVGIRDQLSMLLRLTLAEHLHLAVVLDDQLVHSDPDRFRWIRDLLLEHAKQGQFLVFTCRPVDYLVPQDTAPDSRPIHVVDLVPILGAQ